MEITDANGVLNSAIGKDIDEARARARDTMFATLRKMQDERAKPFTWKRPTLTESQVKKAARLQEKDTLVRFLDIGFEPSKQPEKYLLASFKVTPPKGETLEEAANHVTLESSTGTWTDVQTETSYTLSLAGTVYECIPEVDGKAGHVKVAYPLALFEPGSIPQLFSCITGNILAMKAVEYIKVMDFHMPPEYIATFPGPRFGIPGIREVTKTHGHTLVGTIPKPKTGLFADEQAEVLYKTFKYCSVVKDDENLTDQEFDPYYLRAYLSFKRIEEVEAEHKAKGIDQRKLYVANVTSGSAMDMLEKAYFVKEMGAIGCMIDIITGGFTAVQTLREHGPPLLIHGHRAMHASFARTPMHGVDMMVIAKCCRLAGIDELHIGTVVGKMEGDKSEILNYAHCISQEDYVPEVEEGEYNWFFPQKWYGMRPVMPVNSGGLYPKHLIELAKMFGTDTVTTMGGGIHGYGTLDGAWAARLAAEAAAAGYSLDEIAADYDNKIKEIGFTYPRPKSEAMEILGRVLKGKDWKAMAFSEHENA